MVIRWSSIANHRYTIHYATNARTGFSVLQSNIPATPAINHISAVTAATVEVINANATMKKAGGGAAGS